MKARGRGLWRLTSSSVSLCRFGGCDGVPSLRDLGMAFSN